jgi:hypothetical protein
MANDTAEAIDAFIEKRRRAGAGVNPRLRSEPLRKNESAAPWPGAL